MGRILYFEGAGCEGTQVNDVENCRIRTAFKTDDGRQFYLELMSGCENYCTWNVPAELIGSKGTKKRWGYDYYVTFDNMIIVDFCFEIFNRNGDCNSFRHPMERQKTMMKYTKENILRLVNVNLNCSFTEMKVLPWLSGYRVHSDSKRYKYNLMDDFVDIPERTAERNRIYHEVAREYFTKIYKDHVKANPKVANLMSRYESWSLVKYTDKSITIRSHTYSELIDEDQRVKTWRVNY